MDRIDKLLSNMGIGSRSEIKAMIKRGEIRINGEVCRDAGMKIEPADADVSIGGRPLAIRKYFYFMMNKPAGWLSAARDKNAETVVDLLEPQYRNIGIFPAGRLDKDSRGLLLLTNDGELGHDLTSPRHHVDKEYYIRYDGKLDADAERKFAEGLPIDGGEVCLPAKIRFGGAGEAYITIHEGKFHQVKRMIAAVGGEVTYLKRLSIGNLRLDDDLSEGQYRILTDEEVESLRRR